MLAAGLVWTDFEMIMQRAHHIVGAFRNMFLTVYLEFACAYTYIMLNKKVHIAAKRQCKVLINLFYRDIAHSSL